MPDNKIQPQQPPVQGPQQRLNIAIDENVGEGTYSNLVLIAHTPAEFVMDFARVMPGVPKTKVQARVIMTPQHLKGFAKALQQNVEQFEKRFGEIKIQGMPDGKEFGFRSGPENAE
ncbi:hypothetical protein CEE37_00925 [candidate division LCP-89 bacterium B3_LCP]|uniref:DUF3467 domain-containing protein n=1 Tax=candidate division LCP-89 bacterium B3_LCP TaxID=2012998 RepID=A0A532V4Z5_UNCL8|nr:MAG: hypothetical protein CEE37_00925 [candidate division LCP-89 bacterium B3_LCP]